MHLSLKGSLIRSPMLNRVGQRLLQLFEGASAAYSLRDLASNIASVVRVRRASDNSEKDFSAVDVSSGAMTQWVNAQVVPPLDVRELVDGERTGALIPAAAAYSLRNLSTSYTGDVVDVRRSSDDTEDSFTAEEVADGTLEAWVNTQVEVYNNDYESSVDFASISGAVITQSSDNPYAGSYSARIALTAGDATAYGRISNLPVGSKVKIAGFYRTDGTSAVNGDFGDFQNGGQLLPATSSWTAFEIESSQFLSPVFNFIDLGINGTPDGWIELDNVSITTTLSSGFVSKWYDQSGNANHATQGTDASQPKIVDAGSLISGGLDFDGVDDTLSVIGNPVITASNAGTYSSFSVQDLSASEAGYLYGNASVATIEGGTSFYASSNGSFRFSNRSDVNRDSISRTAGLTLLSAVYQSGASGMLVNGAGTVNSGSGYDFVAGRGDFIIANRNEGFTSSSTILAGKIQEIIIYNSDQSDNRTAFEANIGETYGIDLPSGVDTGYDQVDGFVETWYDQSGNGNDAVQSVASSQPKIVVAGSLVTGGIDFDGVDDELGVTSFSASQPITSFSVFSQDSTSSSIYGSGGAHALITSSTNKISLNAGVALVSSASISLGTQALVSALANSTSSFTYINGGNATTGDAGTTGINSPLKLGNIQSGRFMDGKLQELIIYNSDQSANRVAIETNINNQYDIY